MGFNKLYLPEVTDLRDYLERGGEKTFQMSWVLRYLKADAIIGSSESIDFIKQFMVKEDEKNNIAGN